MRTPEMAAAIGMDVATFRKAMMRERKRNRDYQLPKDQWPDLRTPLYDAAAVEAWARGRAK